MPAIAARACNNTADIVLYRQPTVPQSTPVPHSTQPYITAPHCTLPCTQLFSFRLVSAGSSYNDRVKGIPTCYGTSCSQERPPESIVTSVHTLSSFLILPYLCIFMYIPCIFIFYYLYQQMHTYILYMYIYIYIYIICNII